MVKTRFTQEMVRELREMATTDASYGAIAERFGITVGYVSQIARGIAQKRAPGPISDKRPFFRKARA